MKRHFHPNATIAFETRPTVRTGRNANIAAVASTAATIAAASFSTAARISPVSDRDRQVTGIIPQSFNRSDGDIFVGTWRLDTGVTVPAWIIDGLTCSISFDSGKPVTGTFYKVIAKATTGIAARHQLGPDFWVHVARTN